MRTPVVWSESHRLHEPGGEVWVGVRTPGTEVPERAERIRAELERAGAPIHEGPLADPDAELAAVHDRALLDYLAAAWGDWEAAGLTDDPGQDRVVPYIFPLAELLPDRPPARPAAVSARAGLFAYDTMTLIGPGTWEAARAAAATAVTAADLVLGGEPAAYACCRPPGHHATRARFGGSCYLNNAAVAAGRLRANGSRVAVIDVDAHHGNGTQSIFYANAGVLVGSVHVDPGEGWFPHFLGLPTRPAVAPAPGESQRPARAGHRRRPLAGGGRRPGRVGPRGRGGSAGGVARSRRRRGRSREPAGGHRRRLSRRRPESSESCACRRSSSRRADTTSTRSGSWCARP